MTRHFSLPPESRPPGLSCRSYPALPRRIVVSFRWRELATIREDFPASWMIWEDAPLPEISGRLESIGVGSVVYDPCAGGPASGDFPSLMEENVRGLHRAFASEE